MARLTIKQRPHPHITQGTPGTHFAFQQLQGVVIGLGDRALECKACAPWSGHTCALTSRVIALQNRMRLTRSPRRARSCAQRLCASRLSYRAPRTLRQHRNARSQILMNCTLDANQVQRSP